MQTVKPSANFFWRCASAAAACCCASFAADFSVVFWPLRPATPPAAAPTAAPLPASPAAAPMSAPAAAPFAAPFTVPPFAAGAAAGCVGAGAVGSIPVFVFDHAKHSFSSKCCCSVVCPFFGYTNTPIVEADALGSNGG